MVQPKIFLLLVDISVDVRAVFQILTSSIIPLKYLPLKSDPILNSSVLTAVVIPVPVKVCATPFTYKLRVPPLLVAAIWYHFPACKMPSTVSIPSKPIPEKVPELPKRNKYPFDPTV